MTRAQNKQPSLGDFYQEAKQNVMLADDMKYDGAIPEHKETINCKKHGLIEKIYNPVYDKLSDGIRGKPPKHHYVISACKKCLEDEQERLLGLSMEKLRQDEDRKKEGDLLLKIESYGVSLRNVKHEINKLTPMNDSQKDAINTCSDIGIAIMNNNKTTNLILSGSVGTGKTLIAGALVSSLIRNGYYAKIRTISHIIRTFKGSWGKAATYTEQDVIDDMIKLDLLVIDEVGVQFGSDTEKMFIFEIIDGRYNKMKPTILISNLSMPGIKELIGERCIDRLREDGGKVIAFDSASQRGVK